MSFLLQVTARQVGKSQSWRVSRQMLWPNGPSSPWRPGMVATNTVSSQPNIASIFLPFPRVMWLLAGALGILSASQLSDFRKHSDILVATFLSHRLTSQDFGPGMSKVNGGRQRGSWWGVWGDAPSSHFVLALTTLSSRCSQINPSETNSWPTCTITLTCP